ncbi:flavin-dependent oxidoreductase [Aliishimia ponticola]|uniref:Flavin-dependent oxidoreductase n=1 Tax=Aliishimia ponticola TaxID=2499833 RepID=A0A4S4NF17_9RHOB|nr:flavin-dependent oxidoreductase [Aliishimia ponticola]THH37167.1 flavin-dependent oxidoreductase [Aliishimia ponticola]
MTVLIAGAGIAGLTLGLTLHQIGQPFRIYESVAALKPLGVGINLQPNAVRELFELGLEDVLDGCGIRTQEYGFFTKTGLEIWTEPRGLGAGYHWPQYSVHRGKLQMGLYAALLERAGPDAIVTGRRAVGFDSHDDHAVLHLDGGESIRGAAVIAADGINSALRAQMYPEEGAPIWNGAVLWRATTQAKPFRTGASMILAGHDHERIVAYPISPVDPDTGLAQINWIAEIRRDPAGGWRAADYNKAVDIDTFLPTFAHWDFGWLDCAALIRGAEKVLEYPMIDRDPLPRWTHGRVTLMGDAAHPAYPVGSNGASQAIVDARLIGAQFQAKGVSTDALLAFEEIVRPQMANVVAANRSGNGPDGVMQMVEDRCGGTFARIEDVIPRAELAAHAEKFKALAGFGIDALNARPSLIRT